MSKHPSYNQERYSCEYPNPIPEGHVSDAAGGIHKPHSAGSDDPKKQAAQYDQKKRFLTVEVRRDWLIFLLSIATLGVVAYYTYITWQMWVQTRLAGERIEQELAIAQLQAATASKALRDNENSFRIDERAWLVVRKLNGAPPARGLGLVLTGEIYNTGKTPAYILSEKFGSAFMNGYVAELPKKPAYQSTVTGRIVVAPGESGLGIYIPAPRYSADIITEVRNEKKTLNFYGAIEYTDIFGATHQTRFCYHYVWRWSFASTEGLTACSRNNDAD